ncbi:PAAR domain-containing protein [Lysobacter arvi]|uniref:PAAR domain-containing protein n=1 Tax=Lysobacter arvi TaxID=3038776 RepID=A0ABU1CFU9_9GAMM|nr:PAAR domain-containing protein [Lysobacter arvi]MDR0183830.1 PAAR domain-containing protein [Lysobacter arvi]
MPHVSMFESSFSTEGDPKWHKRNAKFGYREMPMFGGEIGFLRLGDKVEGGGQVIRASGTGLMLGGLPTAVQGDFAYCETHGGEFPIVEGTPNFVIDGRLAAFDKHRLACGCRVLSSCNGVWGLGKVVPVRYADAITGTRATPAVPEQTRFTDRSSSPSTGVALRIGLFFDGTNNNALNTAVGDRCREEEAEALMECRPYMLKDGSSFQNGPTNVSRLRSLYRNSTNEVPKSGEDYFIPIYVDGIGTTTGGPDSLLTGQGLGVGKTGVVERAEQALAGLQEQITPLMARCPEARIASMEFDLFGFSRGAAAARHAVNQINRKRKGFLGLVLASLSAQLAPDMDYDEDVRVGFVGLFDTVVSTGGLSDGLDVRDEDNQGVETYLSPDCARKVVHLTARDEVRANFIMTSAKPHLEIALPGAHSDVGGSYRDDHEGPLWLTRPIWTDEGPVEPSTTVDREALRTRSMAHQAATQWMEHWRKKLHIDHPHHLSVDSWTWIRPQRERGRAAMQPHWYVYAAVKLDRPIRWEYQLIPLRLMHKLAVEAGVPFEPIDENAPDLAIPDELRSIAAKLLEGQALDGGDEALLARKYLHQSAHWNADSLRKLGPAGTSFDLVYVSRPDPTGRRTVRDNR